MLLFTDCYLHFAALKPHYLPLRKRVGSMSETGSSSPLWLWFNRSLTAFGTREDLEKGQVPGGLDYHPDHLGTDPLRLLPGSRADLPPLESLNQV